MRLQLRGALFLLDVYCILVFMAVVVTTNIAHDQEKQLNIPLIYGAAIISSEARAARIAEFISSHKTPDNVEESRNTRLFNNYEDETLKDRQELSRIQDNYKNFRMTSVLYDDKRSVNGNPLHNYAEKMQNADAGDGDALSGVHLSSKNPTTMLPVLTTQRETKPFDFIPVNIIQEDTKGNSFTSHNDKNFEDLGDISLIPAGSNTRIQVKKGPNGKDYEYEYVYYYYDEEDDEKSDTGVTASNSQEIPTRTSAPNNSRRSNNSNRNKYSTLDRTVMTTTIEPIFNEVVPTVNSNRARQLEAVASHEEVPNERLPTNTRFPPRSRTNVLAETTERTNRGRGNRQRTVGHEVVDSNSFRTVNDAHVLPDGPEFPQNLPNGPVRFLGVTANEGNDEKVSTPPRGRGRPQRILEPMTVQINYQDPQIALKKFSITGQNERFQS